MPPQQSGQYSISRRPAARLLLLQDLVDDGFYCALFRLQVLHVEACSFGGDCAALCEGNGKTAADIKTVKHGRAIVRGGQGTAARTVGLLGGIFAYAVDCGMIDTSPVLGVKRFADKRGNRYLSQKELVALGEALRKAEEMGENPSALAILKLLIFTGARKGEIETLTWPEIDFDAGYLKLADSKTGQKAIPLNAGALQVLNDQKRLKGSDYVFPAYRGDEHYEGTPKVWKRIRAMAELQDVRLHDLRHSFASIAVSGGASLPIIGALLGHTNSSTTQRYAHLSDDPLRAASEAVGSQISAALAPVQRNSDASTLLFKRKN